MHAGIVAILVCLLVFGFYLEQSVRQELDWSRRYVRLTTNIALACAIALFLEGIRHAWAFSTDDAYISLRYAKNLAAGVGLGFNPNEARPVEGYSNFTYVALGALAIRFGLDPILTLKGFSVGAACLGLVATNYLFRRFVGRSLAALGLVYLATYYGLIWWTASGLETAFFMSLVVIATGLVIPFLGGGSPPPTSSRLVAAGVTAALAAMTRPEGAVIGLTLGLCLVARYLWLKSKRPEDVNGAALTWFGVSFGVPFALFVAWRCWYYGRILPNTVYCKEGWTAKPWALVEDMVAANGLFIVAAVAGLSRLRDIRVWPVYLVPLAYVVLLYGVDPIIGHETRHFIGSLPLLVGAGLIGISSLARSRSREVFPYLALLVTWLGLSTSPPSYSKIDERAEHYAKRMEIRTDLARALDQVAKPGSRVLLGDTGVIPFESNLEYIDAYCLNNLSMTSEAIGRDPERFAESMLSHERPDYMVINSRSTNELVPHVTLGVWPAIVARNEFQAEYEFAWSTRGDLYSRYWVFRRRSP